MPKAIGSFDDVRSDRRRVYLAEPVPIGLTDAAVNKGGILAPDPIVYEPRRGRQ